MGATNANKGLPAVARLAPCIDWQSLGGRHLSQICADCEKPATHQESDGFFIVSVCDDCALSTAEAQAEGVTILPLPTK